MHLQKEQKCSIRSCGLEFLRVNNFMPIVNCGLNLVPKCGDYDDFSKFIVV
jgi:hypothetical protein